MIYLRDPSLQLVTALPIGSNSKMQRNLDVEKVSMHVPTKCACARPTKVSMVKNFMHTLSLAIPLGNILDQHMYTLS